MMKKFITHVLRGLLVLTLIVIVTRISAYAQEAAAVSADTGGDAGEFASVRDNEAVYVETDKAPNGVVTLHYDAPLENSVVAFVTNSTALYMYSIRSSVTNIPLQMGDGAYEINVYEKMEDTKYIKILIANVVVDGLRDEEVYTNSIQMVDYEGYKDVIDEINKLLADAQGDREKVEIVYNYIITNYSYSTEKAEGVRAEYLPDLRDFFTTGKGICYDYASLFASVLRSNGIPTKLLMGYRNDVEKYHSWNEVLLDGKWLAIDTSCDAQLVQAGIAVEMIKDSSIFSYTREY